MNRIHIWHICTILFFVSFGGLVPVASADENLKGRLERDLQHIRAEVAPNVNFLILDGASNENDAAQVAAFLGPDVNRKSPKVKDILSAFGPKQESNIRFRAFPFTLPAGPSTAARNICIIKFDYSTPYTLDRLLTMLKTSREAVTAKGIDLSKITADRLLTHIWHHEIWHCMDMLGGKADSYAYMLDNSSYPMDTLFVAYKRFTEIGADVFASMLDIKEYGDPEVSRLVAFVRKQNLRIQDLEHYSSPAIMDVVGKGDKVRNYSIEQIVAATEVVRQKYTSSLDQFVNLKEAYDPMGMETGTVLMK